MARPAGLSGACAWHCPYTSAQMARRILLIASFLGAFTQIAYGATDPGSASCAAWLKERVTTGDPDFRTWAIDAVQQYESRLPEHSAASFADSDNILTHVDIYCEAHPSERLDHALQSVIGDFEELRKTLEELKKGS